MVWRKARIEGARILEAMVRERDLEVWVAGWCFEYDARMEKRVWLW